MGGLRSISALRSVVREGQWRELREAIEAQLALLRAQFLLMTEPRGSFTAAADPGGALPASVEQQLLAERLATAVVRAARYGVFRPRCLARAVALSHLLSAHGVVGHRIRIGVSQENGVFVAHAWVERGSAVLGDSAVHTSTFAPLTDVRIQYDSFA